MSRRVLKYVVGSPACVYTITKIVRVNRFTQLVDGLELGFWRPFGHARRLLFGMIFRTCRVVFERWDWPKSGSVIGGYVSLVDAMAPLIAIAQTSLRSCPHGHIVAQASENSAGPVGLGGRRPPNLVPKTIIRDDLTVVAGRKSPARNHLSFGAGTVIIAHGRLDAGVAVKRPSLGGHPYPSHV